MSQKYTSIGGQAVLEGVMMRSPSAFVVAVRRADSTIRLRKDEWFGFDRRFSFLRKPFFRGILILLETMANGVVALNYSAKLSIEDEKLKENPQYLEGKEGKKLESRGVTIMTFVTILFSLALGMGLFVFLPHALTALLGKVVILPLDGFMFHFIDGLIKAFLFIAYIFLIGLLPDIKRVFEYHGAEHQAISCFESQKDFTIVNARNCSRYHPRCGTTFIFFLLFISIILFALFFALVPVGQNYPIVIQHLLAIFVKILLAFPIAGISYELIRLSSKASKSKIARVIAFPGLLLQRLTTREPSDLQLEVAIASIKTVLLLEEKIKSENEIANENVACTDESTNKNETLRKSKNKVLSLEEINIESIADLESSSLNLEDFLN